MINIEIDLANYVVVDVEGNGQKLPDIVEIAVQPFTMNKVSLNDSRSWLVRPPRKITHFARNIHGIENATVVTCPTWNEIENEVFQAIKDKVIVAHNASVEKNILLSHCQEWTPTVILDTLKLARATWPNLETYSLDGLIQRLPVSHFEIASFNRHRAGFDAYVTALLFLQLVHDCSASSEDELFDMCNILGNADKCVHIQGELF